MLLQTRALSGEVRYRLPQVPAHQGPGDYLPVPHDRLLVVGEQPGRRPFHLAGGRPLPRPGPVRTSGKPRFSVPVRGGIGRGGACVRYYVAPHTSLRKQYAATSAAARKDAIHPHVRLGTPPPALSAATTRLARAQNNAPRSNGDHG